MHGFTETKQEINADGYITDMKNAILKFVNKYFTKIIHMIYTFNLCIFYLFKDPENPTVMVVNWNTGIAYDSTIIDLTYKAAEDLVNTLISLGTKEKNIHCIGHSLGLNFLNEINSMFIQINIDFIIKRWPNVCVCWTTLA